MRFPDSLLDEIRARLPTSAVVGRRVKLKKQGREFAGLSPFNAEKTPSFFVNDQKGKWFDFSAQKNGDIFTFLMETEGCRSRKPSSGWQPRRAFRCPRAMPMRKSAIASAPACTR